MKMKKIYISPEIEIVECMSDTMIAASLEIGGDGGQYGEGEFDGEATGAARGDWSNMWENM